MAYKFTHSLVVMNKLARDAARTPPPEEGSPFGYVDQSLTISGRTFESHDQRMQKEFLGQRQFISSRFDEVEKRMDGQFKELEKKMDRGFEEVNKEMDGRFKEVDERFREVDERFKEVDRRLKELEKKIDQRFKEFDTNMRTRFEHMQNASRNFLRTRGWEEIYPVGTLDAQGGVHTPEHFPRTVKRFWSLKDPSQSTQSKDPVIDILRLTVHTVDRLIYLLRFYKTYGYEEWGMDADSFAGDSDSDESAEKSSKSSGLPMTLEVAVQSNPEIAHRALAASLGLSYDGIERFMGRAQELGEARAKERSKRKQEEQTSEPKKRRGLKRSSEEGTEVTSPIEPLSSQGRK